MSALRFEEVLDLLETCSALCLLLGIAVQKNSRERALWKPMPSMSISRNRGVLVINSAFLWNGYSK